MIKCRGMWTNRLHPVYLSFCLHLTSSLLMHLLLLQHDRPSCWRAKHAFWTRHASLIKLNARVMGRLSFAAAWLVVMHTLMTFASHCNCPIDFASKKCLLQIVQFFFATPSFVRESLREARDLGSPGRVLQHSFCLSLSLTLPHSSPPGSMPMSPAPFLVPYVTAYTPASSP